MSRRVAVVVMLLAGVLIAGCAKPRPTPVASIPAASVEPSASVAVASVPPSPGSPVPSSPVPSQGPSESAAASQAPVGSPTSSESAVAVTVEAHDLSFRPRQLEAPAGQPVTLAIHNLGRVVHNLTIDELQVQLIASPGETKSEVFASLKPGTYTFYCSVSGHRQAGMEGTLTVK